MVEAIAALDGSIGIPDAASSSRSVSADFGGWFSKELSAVNDQLVGVDREMQKLAVGDTQSLHEVMIHLEEARLSFQLLAQVRNRLLEAYQEVMRMQV